MNAAPYINTPNALEEEILVKKEYKINYLSDYINIIIEKTKNNIIIRSDYYELKLNIENLSLLTKAIFKSIDESFEYINNIFNQNKFRIKEKNTKYIRLIIIIYDIIKCKEKEIELFLKENFDNQNYLIKELFNKYMKLGKEIIEVKNDNKIINDENNKLKQENMNMKNKIESIKTNNNNDIGGIKMNIMNITNQLYQLKQQINQFIFQINQIQQQINSNSMNNNIMSMNNNIMSMNNDIMSMNNNSIMNQNIFNSNYQNNLNSMNQYSNQINNYNEKVDNSFLIYFRFSGFKEGHAPIYINFKTDEKISTLIEKFRNKANFYDINVKFIFNARRLNPNLTIEEAGISNNNSNIFIVSYLKLTFKIERLNNYCFPIIFEIYKNSISELINKYLDYSGLNRSDIIRFEYNSKILNENKSIKEEGLENDSIIYVITNKKLKSISILIKYYDKQNKEYKNIYNMKCLMTEKIEAIIEKYKNIFVLYTPVYLLEAFLNSEKLDENKRIEETKISNNSTIIIK